MNNEKIILGIDPGTNILGFGIIRVNSLNKPHYLDMGVLDLRRIDDAYEKLNLINRKVDALIKLYHPSELAIESPFYGKNAQVILKLGRAQGAAILAAQQNGVKIYEYPPRKAKMTICGNGSASKEQVSLMVQQSLGTQIDNEYFDATDALAIALCHFYQETSPLTNISSSKSWEKFIAAHPERVKK